MQGSDYYKEKIIRLVYSVDDAKSLEMLYGLISKLLAIDDERIFNVVIKLITSISK